MAGKHSKKKNKKNSKKTAVDVNIELEMSESESDELMVDEWDEQDLASQVSEEELSQVAYASLFEHTELSQETPDEQEIAMIQKRFSQSLVDAGKRELAGKRKIQIQLDRILSKFLWTAVVFALVGVIVWQSAEVVAAKIEYTRGNDFYVDLANKHSLASGDNGYTSILYGEKEISSTPDYEAMQNGAVIVDKHTLTSAEKKELAVYNAKLAVLNKQNPDTVGWIYIPGTNIDYPIVMPPADDPEYYMDHDFTGANYSQGAIFIETKCRPGILQNKNTIIVGHNIRLQGMMFNQLVKFGEEDFFNSHSEIYVYTAEGKFVFNVFSFYRVNELYNFRRVSFKNDGDFLQYLESMRNNSWYTRQGVTFAPDDRIITLYTCTNDNVKTNRYVAVAVLKECLLNE